MPAPFAEVKPRSTTALAPVSPVVQRVKSGEDRIASYPSAVESQLRDTAPAGAPHLTPRLAITVAAVTSKENTPRCTYDVTCYPPKVPAATTTATTTTINAMAVQLLSKPRRSSPYLPQLSLAEGHRTSPLSANPEERAGEFNEASLCVPLSAGWVTGTPTPHLSARRLSPLSLLAVPPSSTSPAVTSTNAATRSPATCATVEETPPAASAKMVAFEQRRIPLPPPAVVANSVDDDESGNASSSNTDAGSAAATAAVISQPRKTADTKQTKFEAQRCLCTPRTQQQQRQSHLAPYPPPTGCPASCSTSSGPQDFDNDGDVRGSVLPSCSMDSTILPQKSAPTCSTSLFTSVCFDVAAEDAPRGCAPTSPRDLGTATCRLPPMPPCFSPSPPSSAIDATEAAKAGAADREQALVARDLQQWRRCSRHRQLLMRACNVADARYDAQPVTVHPSRPSLVLGSDCNDASDEHANNASAALAGLPGMTHDGEVPENTVGTPHSAVPYALSEAALRRAEDAARQQESVRHASARSRTSIISRCSTPDWAGVEGGVLFRKNEASPRRGGGSGASGRSPSLDRLFVRPSSTSVMMDSLRDGSGWSRSEVGLWAGSSRQLNLSILTFTGAPALNSFSPNSDSSLIP
ncbi:hypothetical protein ABB37_02398 [Leptomonas pyrrhocoris]|uniref:Uncharacterized protein n=1 Tax=Leptomonas pyrrhocoris TaxID=157538 RepID=A0A0N0DYU6_LEPPY|nr:hypothetical protein ABB37_02398 [Leptomonas pyrrhocoris]KPA84422.1 hypothetical protein ABB37_02398 [Leptomonas pyrrhocoris]|eukprot:XP_015662861.1 hypothetical protein ABB37_02398 [Leptomonas pyrrhocoris]